MQPDGEGFSYPQVDLARCVHCGLCEKICPVLHPPFFAPSPAAYAAKLKDASVRQKSSSGGIFFALAKPILEAGGVVFGAGFDENWNVCHQYAETEEALDKLRRSKYVQSDIGQTFKQAQYFLEQGRLVLFTGTPCQVAGLKNYLGKEYERLLTADIICHGVPSPAVWQKFLQENFSSSLIKAIDFRDKSISWDSSYLSVTCQNKKYPSLPFYLRPLRKLFFAQKAFLFRSFFKLHFGISNLYERPSCHACRFKGQHRAADITMGDLWGIAEICPKQYDKNGVSVLLVNTHKGQRAVEEAQGLLLYTEVPLEKVLQHNPYYAASVEASAQRSAFFARYRQEPLNRLLVQLEKAKPWPILLLTKIANKLAGKWRRLLNHRQ